MIYVVVEELIPEMSEGEHSNIGVVMFAVGFTLMMALDVALGQVCFSAACRRNHVKIMLRIMVPPHVIIINTEVPVYGNL